MVPHSGSGGCAPIPRKPSAATSMVAVAMLRAPCTMSGESELGSTCLNTMRHWLAPRAPAACTNSRSRMLRTTERASRIYTGICTSDTASMAVTSCGLFSAKSRSSPLMSSGGWSELKMVAKPMASRMLGKASSTSVR